MIGESGANARLTLEPTMDTQKRGWSGGQCQIAPDACWIDDVTGEHVDAETGERTKEHCDVEVSGIGESVLLFTPKSPTGSDWLDEKIRSERWQWLGDALGVEHRYAGALIEAIAADGLRVRVL